MWQFDEHAAEWAGPALWEWRRGREWNISVFQNWQPSWLVVRMWSGEKEMVEKKAECGEEYVRTAFLFCWCRTEVTRSCGGAGVGDSRENLAAHRTDEWAQRFPL